MGIKPYEYIRAIEVGENLSLENRVLRRRIAALESMIDAFVAGQSCANDEWKSQAHIAPLFEDAKRRKT